MIWTFAAGTSRQTLGMLSVAAGVSIFSLQDAIVKGMSASFPVHEIVFVRSLVALPSDAPHIRQKTQIAGTQPPLPNSRSVAVRARNSRFLRLVERTIPRLAA